MSVRNLVTAKITKHLVTSVLNLLSSASTPLRQVAVAELVTAAVENYQPIQYAVNNDLGLCIEHLTDACFYRQVTDAAGIDQHYTEMLAADVLVSDLLTGMAHGIAKQLSAPFYDVRSVLPKQAKELATSIMGQVPTNLTTDTNAPLRQFSWGRLESQTVRNSAILYAKDKLVCFKRGTPQSYDTVLILQNAVHTKVEPIASTSSIQPLFTTALLKALDAKEMKAAEREALKTKVATATSLALKPQFHQRWILSAQKLLTSRDIGEAVVSVTDTIDALEALYELVDTSMLVDVCENITTASTTMLQNIETVRGNVHMLRAAMLYPKESLLQDRLVLTDTTVQSTAMQNFVAEGGTESMIHTYLTYLKLNDNYELPGNGASAAMITAIQDKARATVESKLSRLNDIKKSSYMKAMQDAVSYTLDTYNEKQRQADPRHFADDALHIQLRNRALSTLNKKPLEDIALEYLAGMRRDPVAQDLYKSINTALHDLVKREGEVTSTSVAEATCSGITTFLLDRLSQRYVTAMAA